MAIAADVVAEIDAARRDALRGTGGDGHAQLVRLRVAVALGWLNGGPSKVTAENWRQAGLVMALDRATRAKVAAEADAERTAEDKRIGRSMGTRKVAAATTAADVARAQIEGVARSVLLGHRPAQPFDRRLLTKMATGRRQQKWAAATNTTTTVADAFRQAIISHAVDQG